MFSHKIKINIKSALTVSAVISTLLLSGCSVFGGNDFSCKRVGGISGCVSLDTVYKMSENGQVDQPYSVDGKQHFQGDGAISLPKAVINKSGYDVGVPSAGMPVRYGDKVQKIWVFPYQDKVGNYHESSIMYSVIEKSHWVGYPTSSIQNQDEV